MPRNRHGVVRGSRTGVVPVLVGIALTAVGLDGCGESGPDPGAGYTAPSEEMGDTTTYVDSATGVRLVSPEAKPSRFTAVDLPDGLPADFPIPDGAIVTEADAQALAGGARYLTATLVWKNDTRQSYAWFKDRLTKTGYQVIDESQHNQAHRLRARKGDATVDLAVQVHPEYPNSGWTRAMAFVRTGGT